jgi:hypothetical protein
LVLYREGHRRRVPRRTHVDADDAPAVGILGRIGEQVRDDLAHLLAVGPGDGARAGSVPDVDTRPLLPAEPPHGEDLFERLVQPPALGGAGDVALQTLGVALEDLDVLALLGRELPGAAVQKHGERRIHDGQRRAQLVPHVGLPLACDRTLAGV